MNTYSGAQRIKKEEFEVAKNFLQKKKNIEQSPLYQKSIRRLDELKPLNISDTFVCIGCGPLPTTLLFAHKAYKLKRIIGVDNDLEALKLAKDVFTHASGECAEFHEDLKNITLNPKETAHFFIANMVKPKAKVLSDVWHLASDKSKVIVREPGNKESSAWDSILDKIDPEEWHIETNFRTCSYFNSRSILLTKSE